MSEPNQVSTKTNHHEHWIHALTVFFVTALAGAVLLPLVRTRPVVVHNYFAELPNWIRILFGITLCFLFTVALWKLFSPRWAHVAHWRTHPPSWLAVVLGSIIVSLIDNFGQLDVKGFDLRFWHWPVYCFPSAIYVGYKFGFFEGLFKGGQQKMNGINEPHQPGAIEISRSSLTVDSVSSAPWEEIEKWLKTDSPAAYDFLQNREVAHRLANLLQEGDMRSVGLVGPFGAGKTSVVEWVTQELEQPKDSGLRFFTCKFSCWGFDSSASVIHEMLGEAIKKVSAEIDAFNVESLPDSYRQTFAVGGDWVERVSQIVLGKQSPAEQFERLSKLLSHLNARLLFVVEDLDRNDTRSFEVQEVLGFLERLKNFPNLSFILTGGLASAVKMDFAKLCDHIEMLRDVDTRLTAAFISRIHSRCRDVTAFPHIPIAPDDERKHWDRASDFFMSDLEEMTFQQAVASLTRTPRALRHSLLRTYLAWSRLCGEVNLDQLIVLNVIRHGAPEAFNWLLTHWPRLSSPPRKAIYGVDRCDVFKASIRDHWKELINEVEWSPQAVLRAIEFILPASQAWLTDQNGYSERMSQSLSEEKYWAHAVNEAFSPSSVTDQQVARNQKDWNQTKSEDSPFVAGLTQSSEYGDAWASLSSDRLGIQLDDCLLLRSQVFNRLCNDHGVRANTNIGGFLAVWDTTDMYVADVDLRRHWVESHLIKAAKTSLRLASDVWHQFRKIYFGPTDIKESVRQKLIEGARFSVASKSNLELLLDPDYPFTLYHLIFDSGKDDRLLEEIFSDWGWIRKPIIEAIQSGSDVVALATAILCTSRDSGTRSAPLTVDRSVFIELFGGDSQQVINALRALKASSNDKQAEVSRFVNAAQEALDLPPEVDDGSGEDDTATFSDDDEYEDE